LLLEPQEELANKFVEICLESNCQVLGCFSSNEQEAKVCRDEFDKFKPNFVLNKRDISKDNDIIKIYNDVKRIWSKPIDYLVNNAGILHQGNFKEAYI
jgi:short-subunit dehydrogenase